MRFISVRDLRGKSAEVWRELDREKEMVVTSNGRPIAILASVRENDLEESLTAWRRARAAQTVASIQYDSVAKGTDRIGMDEINAEIADVRRTRRSHSQ
jgi:prevent-host-death family protein